MDRRQFLILTGSVILVGACDDADSASTNATLDNSAVPRPTNVLISRWATDPFSRGSYSYLADGARPSDRDDLRADIDGRVFFAGEATSTDFPATVHGALLEGRAAAERIHGAALRGASTVIVIGAGAAGLAAARSLTDLGHEVVVVEGRDRIGGRVDTRSLGGATPVDLGASWIHGLDDNPLTELAADIGAPLFVSDFDSIVVHDAVGGIVSEADLDAAYELFAGVVEQIGPAAPIAGDIETLLSSRDGRERDLITYLRDTEVEHEFGADVGQLTIDSLDEGLAFSGGDALVPGGMQLLVGSLTGGFDVRTSTIVTGISHDTDGVFVDLHDNEPIVADHVLVTVPLGVLQHGDIGFDPPLPLSKQTAIDRLGMGVLEKVVLRFDRPFWEQAEYLGFSAGERSRFTEWVNLEVVTGDPIVVALLGGSTAREVMSQSDQAIVDDALSALATMYPQT